MLPPFSWRLLQPALSCCTQPALAVAIATRTCPLQVNDRVNEDVCRMLEEGGVKFIALRCAGFDKVGVAGTGASSLPAAAAAAGLHNAMPANWGAGYCCLQAAGLPV